MLLCSCASQAACDLTSIWEEQEANIGIIKNYIDIQRFYDRLEMNNFEVFSSFDFVLNSGSLQ